MCHLQYVFFLKNFFMLVEQIEEWNERIMIFEMRKICAISSMVVHFKGL